MNDFIYPKIWKRTKQKLDSAPLKNPNKTNHPNYAAMEPISWNVLFPLPVLISIQLPRLYHCNIRSNMSVHLLELLPHSSIQKWEEDGKKAVTSFLPDCFKMHQNPTDHYNSPKHPRAPFFIRTPLTLCLLLSITRIHMIITFTARIRFSLLIKLHTFVR